ncbi:unnamed protein product [Penicillium nalgiovense]|uniref:F-box domain-containing protein n=1 Tax=Penicillium nalgiovense TaxID=60175 RepID=A0A9W4I2A8_PENNA|nr:unnamed protein product [Penicillium nalgiovense]CAG8005833.1 unnamed protein product [Penicillium nalgiovense]CAG8007082.1 unnamed protein product [Penicillium nalgiovense]CAG8031178.1 unnamed protein product [Penicillium nalgiovense]CAG8038618.1 unnamed protein product [Penicillium nalgiovense]
MGRRKRLTPAAAYAKPTPSWTLRTRYENIRISSAEYFYFQVASAVMLNDLPPEILHLIARDLGSKALYRLVSTSRRLHTVLQQSLYTNVTLCGIWSEDHTINIFLYAVTRTPRLASYVRSLKVNCWEPEKDNNGRSAQRVEFDDKLVHQLVAERTGYSEEEKLKWLKDLERHNSDAWLPLLIPQLKELRKLDLTWPFGSHYVVDMLQKAAIGTEPIFPRLEEAYAAWHDSENAFPSHYMDAFFKFPSMRKLGCYMLAENEKDDDDELEFEFESDDSESPKGVILSPQCSNITDIDLQKSNAAEGMREWVQACKELKSFRLVHGGGVVSWTDFQPRKIYESLAIQKSTLESIWVEAYDGAYMDTDDEWMGSFVDFTALRLICVSLPNLVGFDESKLPLRKLRDVLPSSLETLFLSLDEDESFEVAMDQLAELAASESFPKLAAIYLEYYELRKPENAARLEWLEQRCQEASVFCFPHSSKGCIQQKQMMRVIWP